MARAMRYRRSSSYGDTGSTPSSLRTDDTPSTRPTMRPMSSFLNGIVTRPVTTATPPSAMPMRTSSKIVKRVYFRTSLLMSLTICRLLRSLTSANADVEKSAKASAITNRFFNMMNASSCQPPGWQR